MNSLSLQINLSAGDLAYADVTVPALVAAHRKSVEEVFLVVDCLRPGRTKIVDPDLRFPQHVFDRKVGRIKELAEKFRTDGFVDRIEYLFPEAEVLAHLRSKYLRGVVKETHDYGGCGLLSYLAGIELSRSDFVIHYDADMLLHQEPGVCWGERGINILKDDGQALAVTPRIAPPLEGLKEKPSLYDWPAVLQGKDGWRDQWLSTRCFLLDRRKFERLLPLLQGRVLWDTLAVRFFGRGYPRSPEVMISHRMKAEDFYRVNLRCEEYWLLHPADKGESFLRLLPSILESVGRGWVPFGQRGLPDVVVSEWEKKLDANPLHR